MFRLKYEHIFSSLVMIPAAYGFLFNFNPNQQQQQQQQQEQAQSNFEDRYLNSDCNGYLCPDTMECVSQPNDCPCPFPKSQLRCVLPENRFICISKPTTHDEKLNEVYDDPLKGPKAKNKGIRDCGWVLDAYKELL